MGKGSYHGGSSVIGRGGRFLRGYEPPRAPDAASTPSNEGEDERKARNKVAKAIRKSREAQSAERTERAADLLRDDGLSEREIRRRLNVKRK